MNIIAILIYMYYIANRNKLKINDRGVITEGSD